MLLYFAYGSNLKVERLRSRVGRVELAGIAALGEHRLSFAKRGKDGSGKACCEIAAGERVWGALYGLRDSQLTELDRFEWGYAHGAVVLERADGTRVEAATYHAEHFTDDPTPYDWYKRLLVEGAREHAMPAEWLSRLEAQPSKPDVRKAGAS